MATISNRSKKLTGQPMFDLMKKANNIISPDKEIIHMEIGDTKHSPPNDAILDTVASLALGNIGYADSQGLEELRKEISEYICNTHGFRPQTDCIIVAPANALISFVMQCCLDKGDGVICPDPGFPTYTAAANYTETNIQYAPLNIKNDYTLTKDIVNIAKDNTSKLLIINSPSNPTGTTLSKDTLHDLYKTAKENDMWILSDEVYSEIVYDGATHQSVCNIDKCEKRTILLGSLSKTHCMPGWRMGYVVAPLLVAMRIAALVQTLLSCMPIFTQHGAIGALKDTEFPKELRNELQEKRDIVVEALNNMPGIDCPMPGGAFYVFPSIEDTKKDGIDFQNWTLDTLGVVTLSGSYFGPNSTNNIRISYASCSIDQLYEAMSRLNDGLSGRIKSFDSFRIHL